MFIERLKDEEVLEFIQRPTIILPTQTIREIKINRDRQNAIRVYITLPNGCIRMFSLNDFSIATDKECIDAKELKFEWEYYMCDKFGEEYKKAFNDNIKKKYEAELIK